MGIFNNIKSKILKNKMMFIFILIIITFASCLMSFMSSSPKNKQREQTIEDKVKEEAIIQARGRCLCQSIKVGNINKLDNNTYEYSYKNDIAIYDVYGNYNTENKYGHMTNYNFHQVCYVRESENIDCYFSDY